MSDALSVHKHVETRKRNLCSLEVVRHSPGLTNHNYFRRLTNQLSVHFQKSSPRRVVVPTRTNEIIVPEVLVAVLNGPGQFESGSTLGAHVAQRFEKSVETRMCKPIELGSNVPES